MCMCECVCTWMERKNVKIIFYEIGENIASILTSCTGALDCFSKFSIGKLNGSVVLVLEFFSRVLLSLGWRYLPFRGSIQLLVRPRNLTETAMESTFCSWSVKHTRRRRPALHGHMRVFADCVAHDFFWQNLAECSTVIIS
jgi:hypothetical protein